MSSAATTGSLVFASIMCVFLMHRARRREEHDEIPLGRAMRYMKTGDVILFSKRRVKMHNPSLQTIMWRSFVFMSTYLYRAFDDCEWAHAGVVYRDPHTHQLYLMHCETTGNQPDHFVGDFTPGVQVVPLKAQIRDYAGYCVWRPLNRPLPDAVVHDYLRCTYHMGYRIPADIVIRLIERLANVQRDRYIACHERSRSALQETPAMFCTEWAGALLEFAGVYDSRRAPFQGYWMPSDFTREKQDQYLSPGWSFHKEWELKIN